MIGSSEELLAFWAGPCRSPKLDSQGAAGFTGLTFSITAAGKPNANVTLSGYSIADLSNGKLG